MGQIEEGSQTKKAQEMTVIESFEPYTDLGGGAWQGDLLWIDNGLGHTVSSSASNVTQGTKSWRIQSTTTTTAISAGFGYGGVDTINLTGFDTLSFDYHFAAGAASRKAIIFVYSSDFGDFISAETATGVTTGTLSIDLTTAGFSLADVNIDIGGLVGSGTLDQYVDNLQKFNAPVGGVGKLYLGPTVINKIRLGGTEVKKVYLGDIVAYDKT